MKLGLACLASTDCSGKIFGWEPCLRFGGDGQGPRIEGSGVIAREVLHQELPLSGGSGSPESCQRNIDKNHILTTFSSPVVE